MGLIEDIKTAIRDSGLSHYELGKCSGVSPSTITRFMNGDRGIRFKTAAKIMQYLEYTLEKTDRPLTPE
jgi:transcriptional regulator with XRE-family HTH domain